MVENLSKISMAAKNTCFKNTFSKAEIDACIDWFTQHEDALPASMLLDGGISIPNLPLTVRQMIVHLKDRVKDSAVYSGQFSLLELIRSKIQSSDIQDKDVTS